ncbi:uncharacterized protein H6S33_010136 [Morchella sextelata]|uniref:uncharacterized protein n=1 Tax=Morchella sextelata TaxID=1174677 RepID=UPI001D04B794|nr:uncharacterized protein H6S33_010136 [Morchella sextelata]KAH0612084.1 hypothetical protein H6S33_010136 [Morchella sextelata]
MSPNPLVLSDADISYILSNLDAPALLSTLQILTTALTEFSTRPSNIHQPLRQSITTSNGSTTLFMPSSNTALTAVKTVTLNTTTSASPKGTLTIFDGTTGELQGVLAAEELTGYRTALASMIVLLKRIKQGKPVKRIVVFGTGKQARWALSLCMNLIPDLLQVTIVGRSTVQRARDALPGARKLNEVTKWSLSSPDCKFVALAPAGEPGFEGRLREAVGGADAIFCCTPATEPLFPVEYLTAERARYVSLVGSYKPHMKEIDPAYLRRKDVAVFVDSKEACLKEAGEVIAAGLKEGDLVEVGNIPLGEEFGGNLVFKCVGLAIMDLVVGAEVLRRAREEREKLVFSSAYKKIWVEIPDFS